MGTFSERLRASMDSANMKAVELHERTGISKASISEYLSGNYEPKQRNIFKIAQALNVSPSYLMGVNDDPRSPVQPPAPASSDLPDLTPKDEREIMHLMDDMKEKLMQEEGLMFDGQPASPESIQSILDAMQIGMEMAKKRNKAKYTPKKFRHED